MELQLTIAEAPHEANPVSDGTAEVMTMVMRLLTDKYPSAHIDQTADIFSTGLMDSQAFLDFILEVEGLSGMEFNPEALDFNGDMTPITLAQAFKVI